jgi:protein TonB
MTIAADRVGTRDRAAAARWVGSLFLVLALHAAAVVYLLSHHIPIDAAGSPPAAVMIDLAPLPAPTPPAPAPPIPMPEPAAKPQPQPLVEPPPLPPAPDIPLPEVAPSPAPKPAVVLPKPPPKLRPRPVKHPPQVEPDRPPPAAAPPVSAAPPAPAPTPPAVKPAPARVSWQQQLVGWLERYKRYPRLAQEQRQEGTVYLHFTMDRQGRVLSSRIEKGSGSPLLDDEVASLIQRAQPLPAPPAEIAGTQVTLTLPVQFSLRGGSR